MKACGGGLADEMATLGGAQVQDGDDRAVGGRVESR